MSDTPTGNDLQFDNAEYTGPLGERPCASCATPLAGHYYEINGAVACETCTRQVHELRTGGSGFTRFIVAGVLGSIAAILGTLLYWGVLHFTGYEVGIIAIAVGFIVGKAVQFGSSHRGGWLYQLLAVGLTYLSITASYVPVLDAGMREEAAAEAPSGTADGSEGDASLADYEAVPPVLRYAGLMLLALITPFLLIVESPIGVLIIAIGLWQAFASNRKLHFEITGPHEMAMIDQAHPLPAPGEDEGPLPLP